MNPFAISALLTGLTSLFLGIFVLFKSRGSKINKIWSVFCFSVAIWGFGSLKVALTLDAVQALFWWKVTYIGIIFIPIFYHHFVHEFLKIKSKILLYSFYIYGFFYVIIEWTHLDYLFFNINNITLYFDSLYFVYPPTFLFLFFVFSWFGIIIYSHIELYRAFKNSYGLGREQIKYFFIGMVVAFAGGGTCYLPCFGVALYPYLNFAGPFYPAVITYAIVRHRLLDIKVVLRRSTVYLASVLTIILPAIFLLYFADKHYPGLIILVSLTALVIGISIFTPIRNFFYRLANKYFFSSLYDSREVIASISDKLRPTLEPIPLTSYLPGNKIEP